MKRDTIGAGVALWRLGSCTKRPATAVAAPARAAVRPRRTRSTVGGLGGFGLHAGGAPRKGLGGFLPDRGGRTQQGRIGQLVYQGRVVDQDELDGGLVCQQSQNAGGAFAGRFVVRVAQVDLESIGGRE